MASSSRQFNRAGQVTSEPPFAPVPMRREPSRRAKRLAPTVAGGPVEVILVGSGQVAQELYIPALRALQANGELVVRSVVDTLEPARTFLGRAFPKAQSLSSLDAVIVAPGALAIIATPARFHAAQAIAALKRGWHVVCETPLAGTVRHATSIVEAAQRHQRLLAINLYRRSFPAMQYLRTLCRDHLFGPVLGFSVFEGEGSVLPPPSVEVFEKPERAEGVLTDIGVHTFDLLAWCLGTPTVLSYADDAMGGVEANAFVELAFSEGVRGTVHLSRDWPTAHVYQFVFERGIVRWNVGDANRLTVQLANAPAALQAILVRPLTPGDCHGSAGLLATRQQSFITHMRNVMAAIASGEARAVPAMDALQSLTMIEECYARRTFLDPSWLTANEAAHARALCLPAEPRRS